MKQMKKIIVCLFALLGVAQGVWAQTDVDTESALKNEVKKNNANIRIAYDITLTSELVIEGNRTVTIDLYGFKLDRGLTSEDETGSAVKNGHVIRVAAGSTLIINCSGWGGITGEITGGFANDGGGIYNEGTLTINGGTICYNRSNNNGAGIYNAGTLTINGGVIKYNYISSGSDEDGGGAGIYNKGTLTMKQGNVSYNSGRDDNYVYRRGGGFYLAAGSSTTIENTPVEWNESRDGGGFYVESGATLNLTNTDIRYNAANNYEGGGIANHGTVVFNSGTIRDNESYSSGGGIWSSGTLTIKGGTISKNTTIVGDSKGGGVYIASNSTLNMEGKPVIKDNRVEWDLYFEDGPVNNLYLTSGTVINVTGALTSGADIRITAETPVATLTSGYNAKSPKAATTSVFRCDAKGYSVTKYKDEVCSYQVPSTMTASYLRLDGTTDTQQGCYKISGISDVVDVKLADGWYVLDASKSFSNRISISGNVNLILTDGAKLTANGGIGVTKGNNITIWCQSGGTGEIYASPKELGYDGLFIAGIGGDWDVPESGIITINGGKIGAQGESGIGGGGRESGKGTVYINGGTVNAIGGMGAPGIGGYATSYVTITGGVVTGTGGGLAPGIGATDDDGYITISGGTVTGYGGQGGAGIGAGWLNNGYVTITGGTVKGYRGDDESSGIGNGAGAYRFKSTLTISYTDDVSVFSDSYYTKGVTGATWGTTVKLLKNFYDTDGKLYYAGTADNIALGGKTLIPAHTFNLADDADNSTTLNTYGGKKCIVTLADRVLYKDGSWNTLCLPFNVNRISGTPLEGAIVKELDTSSTSLSGKGLLTLTFSDPKTSIEAGKPYIVKWNTNESNGNAVPQSIQNIVNPTFTSVTINNAEPSEVTSDDGNVKFVGHYSPFVIDASNKNEILFVSTDNRIGYVLSDASLPRQLKNFRAHFQAKPGESGAAGVRAIRINWDDDETTSIESVQGSVPTVQSESWYTLDGRRLNGMPTQPGVYIHGSNKVVIK